MSINIQVHEVSACKWEARESVLHPKVLVIQTLSGEQRISLFPVRDNRDGAPTNDVEPDKVAA